MIAFMLVPFVDAGGGLTVIAKKSRLGAGAEQPAETEWTSSNSEPAVRHICHCRCVTDGYEPSNPRTLRKKSKRSNASDVVRCYGRASRGIFANPARP